MADSIREHTLTRRHSTDTLNLRSIVSPSYSLEGVAPFKAVCQPRKATHRFLVGNLTISSHDRWFWNMQDYQFVQRGCEPEHLRLALADVTRDLQMVIRTSHAFITGLKPLSQLCVDRGGEKIDMHHLYESFIPLYNLSVSLGCLLSRATVESADEAARMLSGVSGPVSGLRDTFELLSRDMQKLVDQEARSDVTVADKVRAMENFDLQSVQKYADLMRDLILELSGTTMALLAEKI